ncbi:MAG: purine-cytosine permease family protein [Thermoplasmata archaeon]
MVQDGIEAIPEKFRKGNPFNQFTLWFAANLTLADFAIGFIPLLFNLSIFYSLLGIILGTLLGAFVVAAFSSMGPEKGKTQMMISEDTFKGSNFLFSFFQGVSALGWFIVNLILGTMAIITIFKIDFIPVLIIYGIIQLLIAYFGHDYIHKLEKIFSIFLGIMFLYITIFGNLSFKLNYSPDNSIIGLGVLFASAFAYIASWAPYASDYSRFLPGKVSKTKVFIYSFTGSFLSTVWIEILGFMVAIKTLDLNSMEAAFKVSGYFGILVASALALGGIGTNSINIYSSSLSFNAIFKNFKRMKILISVAIISFIIAIIGYFNFYSFYEDFLYLLDYWIMPWAGVIIADYIFVRTGNSKISLLSFIIGLGISIPFMNPGVLFSGPVSNLIGGVDISYFVSFIVSMTAYILLSKKFILSQQSLSHPRP